MAHLLLHPEANEQAIRLNVIPDARLKQSLLEGDASSVSASAPIANELEFTTWREQSVRDEFLYRQKQREAEAKWMGKIVTIQRHVRGWIKRRLYRRHKEQLKGLQRRLMLRNQTSAALVLQKSIRGWIARREFSGLRADYLKSKEEEKDEKKKKPKSKKKGEEVVLTHTQQLVKDQELFIKGMLGYLSFRYDEAISGFEKHFKKFPEDVICERLLERAKFGKAVVAEELKQAKAMAKEGKKARATTPSGKPAAKRTKSKASIAPPPGDASLADVSDISVALPTPSADGAGSPSARRKSTATSSGRKLVKKSSGAAADGRSPTPPSGSSAAAAPAAAAPSTGRKKSATPTLPNIAPARPGGKTSARKT